MTPKLRHCVWALCALALVSCSSTDQPNSEDPATAHSRRTEPADCVGQPGDIIVSAGGVYSISKSQRVGIMTIDFSGQPTVKLKLVTGTPAGKQASAGVGDLVTFNHKPYTVTQICRSHVELDRGRPKS